tara:strand:+ start:1502 stop:1732 length:231 start_codon:yes stop_codon:yes gene_type:complete
MVKQKKVTATRIENPFSNYLETRIFCLNALARTYHRLFRQLPEKFLHQGAKLSLELVAIFDLAKRMHLKCPDVVAR